MKTFFRFIGHPFPQFWLVRVRKEFKSLVKSSLNQTLFEKEPFFTSLSAQLFLTDREEKIHSRILVKLIQVQKAADYFRRLVFCQGRREFLSSNDLRRIGLKCPIPIGYAINLNPFSRFDSFFICEFLPDAVSISHHVPTLSEFDRLLYLKMIARDVALMLTNNVIHKDLQLNNILLCASNPSQLYWIDNDLRKISTRRKIKNPEAFLSQLTINVKFCSKKEKKFFMEELLSLLNLR